MASRDPFRTYRNPIPQKFGFVGVLVLAVLAVTAGNTGDAIIFIVGIVAVIWSCWWVRLVVARDGVTVWNMRRHRLSWRDIQHVDLDEVVWWAWGGPVLRLNVCGNKPIRVWAVSVSRAGGEGYVRRTLTEVRQAQGTAAH